MKRHNSDIKKILVSRTDNLGDVVMSLPVITALKKNFPDAEITFLIKERNSGLLINYQGIDCPVNFDGFRSFYEKLNFLRKGKFDAAVTVFPRFELALLFFLARIKIRIGTGYRWYSFLFNKKVFEHRKYGDRHETEYNLNLLKPLIGESKPDVEFHFKYSRQQEENFYKKIKSFNLLPSDRYIIIHPGSRKSSIDWSLEKFKKLTQVILKQITDYKVVLTGVKEESPMTDYIFTSVSPDLRGGLIDLAGKISLSELLILIDKSSLFISNATGPIHIAGALNKKIIGFYPNRIPINETRWRPLSDRTVIMKPEGTGDDMDSISVQDTLTEIYNLLKI